jgi:hypothetical protein
MSNWDLGKQDKYKTYGFIYMITNKVTGRQYIGQKRMWFSHKLKPLKGKKMKRKCYYLSDYETYTGSSNELNADIKKLGIDKFMFDILRFCNSKFELHYYELKEQVDREVMLSTQYYNALIRVRISKPKYKPKSFTMTQLRGKYYVKAYTPE